MPYINYRDKEIAFKIVYYGPGLSGKTTNLKYIHTVLDKTRKGEMIVLDTEQERTLFFDFFPLELGKIEGYAVRFNMYTVPGQVYSDSSIVRSRFPQRQECRARHTGPALHTTPEFTCIRILP
jgi:GTPase SAR1 family protein